MVSDRGDFQLSLETIELDGIAYVSLPPIIETIGGAYNLLPTRVRVDFSGTTAWLTIGDERVHALSIFSLQYPIRERDTDVLIALADLAPFFLKSFRAKVTVPEPESPEPEITTDAVGTEDAEPVLPPVRITGRRSGIVVLDPGHGGYDTGLEGGDGFQEKSLCLDVALRAKALLEKLRVGGVVLTRNSDLDLSEAQRTLLANNSGGDLLVSIHAGGTASPRTSGVALYYKAPRNDPVAMQRRSGGLSRFGSGADDRSRQSRALALSIASEISATTSATMRGVQSAPLRLLNQSAMPSVMVEVGCLTNPTEETLLESEDYRERIALGIVQGILSFLEGTAAGSDSAGNALTKRLDTKQ